MAVLNSNPEVLLKKRKDKDIKRLQKQEEAKAREQAKIKKLKAKSKKFIRPETLISNHKSKFLEHKRVQNINSHEARNSSKNGSSNDNTKQNQKSSQDEDEKLLFVVRIPNFTKGLKIPNKPQQILKLLRLENVNNGVFMKLSSNTRPLVKLIEPYVVYGCPSLQSIRQLFQKRSNIKDAEGNVIKLDNNQLVEDQFEDIGVICIEDIIQELCNLSENFKDITNWLMPFKLNLPVVGFGPQSKLAKLKLKQHKNVSLSGSINLHEVDIDKVIEEQN